MTPFRFSLLLVILLPAFICAQQTQPNHNCNCPQFQVVSNLEVVKAGETVEFEVASAVDASVLSHKYEWTVSAGTILRGQGTGKIVVQTTEEMRTTPQPSPTPLPPAGRDGYLIDVFVGRQRPLLTITATPNVLGCSCRSMSASVQMGRENREKNKPANVTDLTIGSEQLTLPCEPGSLPREGVVVSPSMVVDVAVTAEDPENDVITYSYTVSGGRIVGTGADVKWDLSTVAPGTYTITAGVDDGCGICGKTQTRTVTVMACEPTCSFIECPTIELFRPSDDRISPGENTFTANVSGGTQQSVTYEWAVNNGDFTSGQGTPSIVIKFTEDSAKLPTSITLRVGGIDPRAACITEQTLIFENGRLKP